MHRTSAFLALLALCLGCAHQAATDTNDIAEVYRAFIDSWTGKEKDPINVSITAKLPSNEELKQFSDCAGKGTTTRWMPVESMADLGNSIGELSYVRLIDPDKWKPRDPGDAIARGQSVDSAVESGFAHGLLTLSAIAFDEPHQTAAFTYSFVCGGLCGNGGAVIFRKTPAGWVRSGNQCGGWISYIQRDSTNNSLDPNPHQGGA